MPDWMEAWCLGAEGESIELGHARLEGGMVPGHGHVTGMLNWEPNCAMPLRVWPDWTEACLIELGMPNQTGWKHGMI